MNGTSAITAGTGNSRPTARVALVADENNGGPPATVSQIIVLPAFFRQMVNNIPEPGTEPATELCRE